MDDKTVKPQTDAPTLPPVSEWQEQWITHWKGRTYRLRLLDTANPRWVVSFLDKGGEYIYVASGLTKHDALRNAQFILG